MLKRFGLDGFILSLFGAIFLAWLYPDFGARDGVFSLSTAANVGVSLIFFFYGLRLNWEKIRSGLANVKTHLVVMASTFLLFPLLILATMSVCGTFPTRADVAALEAKASGPGGGFAAIAEVGEPGETGEREETGEPTQNVQNSENGTSEETGELAQNGQNGENGVNKEVGEPAQKGQNSENGTSGGTDEPTSTAKNADRRVVSTGIWLGIFFLAALPSTVSSSVVMTNIARGNVPAAIFDASFSTLLGVFITPLWMRIFVDAETGGRGFGVVLLSLTAQAILPIILGVLANRRWGEFSRRNEKRLRKFDQATIVLIVYTSFCNSFAEKMFDGLSGGTLLGLSVGMIALFFVVFGIVYVVCRALRFSREDAVATLFCGSKKSLVHGVATSRVILSAPNMAGILILPTMIYHALQLIIVSVIAQRFAKIAEREETERARNGANV
ncbi:MAG: bile acid:sodium symporter [Thermoguttaceae bacterium]|nr:bile acid:sodium symporter [Thermoguttaceae bacterium]